MLSRDRIGLHRIALVSAAAVAALTIAGCSSGSAKRSAAPTTTVPPVSTTENPAPTLPPTTVATTPPSTTAPPTTSPPTTRPPVIVTRPTSPPTTARAAPFPAVIVAAVDAFASRPPGLQAPITLPPAPAAISAQASGLAGTDSVTLIATPQPLPVNDPSLSAGTPGTEDLGTFSTTAASSAAAASTFLSSSTAASVPSCATPAKPAPIGVAGATACTTLMGGLITWHSGPWTVAVEELGSAVSPTSAAQGVASAMTSPGLPGASRGLVSLVIPASAAYGSAPTASLSWQLGVDVYQVRTSRGWSASLSLADAMRPYPGG